MKKLIKLLPIVLAIMMLFSFGALATEGEVSEIPGGETEVVPPEESEITLPEAPAGISIDASYIAEGGYVELLWDEVADVDGYNFYIKKKGKWVLKETFDSADSNLYLLYGLLYNSKYEIGLKSYITVDGVNYESEEMCTGEIVTPTILPVASLNGTSRIVKNEIKLSWEGFDGISGYRLYIRKDGKWVKLKDIYGKDNREYVYKDIVDCNYYTFAIKTFVKGTEGTKFSSLSKICRFYYEDPARVKGIRSSVTASSITLSWDKVEGARGYRIFMYKDGKWKALKTTTALSYTVTGLEASRKYTFRVRAYEKVKGETVWFPYSKNFSSTTAAKAVDAYRVKNLQKDFNDGSWYVKIKDMDDGYGGKVTMTLAGKGKDLFLRYDYGYGLVIKYLYQSSKSRLYIISDIDKEYIIVPKDEAEDYIEMIQAMAEVFKPTHLNKVSAYTTVYNGKSAVKEYYNDSTYGIIRCYFFVNDKLAGMSVKYKNGVYEKFSSMSFTDTPSSSLFKVPSGYKKVSY